MTVFTAFLGLFSLLWADVDLMWRLAVPMIGGLATSFLIKLLVYPVIFDITKTWSLRRRFKGEEAEAESLKPGQAHLGGHSESAVHGAVDEPLVYKAKLHGEREAW